MNYSYIFHFFDKLELLIFALGAGVSFWAFRRCRKVGYLLVAIGFCLPVFSRLVLPRIEAEMRARRTPTHSEERQRKLDAAMSEAMLEAQRRFKREEGANIPQELVPPIIRYPFEPLALVVGVWLLARREPRVQSGGMVSATAHEHTTA